MSYIRDFIKNTGTSGTSSSNGFKNIIVNGAFQVAQLGDVSNIDNDYGCVDRFYKYSQGDESDWGKGYDNNLGNFVFWKTKDTGYGNIRTILEPVNTIGKYTFSCYFKSDLEMDLRIQIWNKTDDTNIFSDTAYQHIQPNVWTKIKLTFDITSDSVNDIFQIMIGRDNGDVVTNLKTAQWQLEKGENATQFEQKHIGIETALCQRYLVITRTLGAGVFNGTKTFFSYISTPVEMRTLPTIKTKSGNWGSINIEDEDDYDVNNVTIGHPGEQRPQMIQITTEVDGDRTNGTAGIVNMDKSGDYFILDAELR